MEISKTKIFKTVLAKGNRTMKDKLLEIYESKITHNSFLDKDSVVDAMTESYVLGVESVLSWLLKMNHLSDNTQYLVDEWKSQNKL